MVGYGESYNGRAPLAVAATIDSTLRDRCPRHLSRGGGITEALRIASLASAAGLPICTHGCHTGLNFAASVHFLASIENAWYFEADGSTDNPLRTVACSPSCALAADGTVLPLEGPGLGVEVDEAFLRAHPLTDGAAWH